MKFHMEGKTVEVRTWPAVVVAMLALALLLAASSLYQVGPEQEALVLRFGRHVKTEGPGLKARLPLGIDRVYKVPTRMVDVVSFGARSPQGARMAAREDFATESSMLTGDLNMVRVGWDVQFTRETPTDFVFNVQEPISTLRDISQSVMREVMGDRASILILTVGRSEVQRRVRELIQNQCRQFGMGIRINEVNLLFVDPPPAVLGAFNDLNKAEQDATRFFEEAAKVYQDRVPRARGEARRMILEAEGFRERRVNVARGEAQRFADTLNAYRQSPEVTRQRFFLETMEDCLPRAREIVVVDPAVRSLLPHLNVRDAAPEKR